MSELEFAPTHRPNLIIFAFTTAVDLLRTSLR